MQFFVEKNSVVRKIWGKSDTILFIFAGAAAEFALNKAVDWLYFTGRLPKDPIGRLFTTVSYARQIVFAPKEDVYEVFLRIGQRMNIPALPLTYAEWCPVREKHMQNDLASSHFTIDLFL